MKDTLRYSQVWEDPRVIQKALQIGPEDTVLCITGAGCNVLNLLLLEPTSMLAVDSNPAQNHLLRLKLAAIECLNRDNFALLFGIAFEPFPTESSDLKARRRVLFSRALPHLHPETARFWQRNYRLISDGIHYLGRLERFQQLFLRFYKRRYKELWFAAYSETTTLEDQERIYGSTIDEPRSLRFNRLLTNRITLRAFRSRSSLQDLNSFDFGMDILTKFRSCVTTKRIFDNFFLSSLLFRAYIPPAAVPPYLIPDNYLALKSLISRVRVIDATAEAFLRGQKTNSIDKINLSNILEWTDFTAFEQNLASLVRVSSDRGRLVVHSTFTPVPEIPSGLQDRIVQLAEVSELLESLSRSIFPTGIRAFVLNP